jgi:hypothetical protein
MEALIPIIASQVQMLYGIASTGKIVFKDQIKIRGPNITHSAISNTIRQISAMSLEFIVYALHVGNKE